MLQHKINKNHNFPLGLATTTSNLRMHKINEIMHRELAKIINLECKDPRLGIITVTAVVVSKDLAIAKVLITVLEESKVAASIEILNNAAAFLRMRLAKEVNLRKTPTLRFVYDQSIMAAKKIDDLFDSISGVGIAD